MGVRVSKAMRASHGQKAAASPRVATSQHGQHQTEPRQEPHVDGPVGFKEHDTTTSTSPAAHDTLASPATSTLDAAMDRDTNPPSRPSVEPPSAVLSTGTMELPGDVADDELAPLPQPALRPSPQVPRPRSGRTCVICCTAFPGAEAAKLVTPCRCESPCCVPCLRAMFIAACKDLSRMPPRCCTQIPLHHVRQYLTEEEADEFRSKYEEWGTPKPFYCPIATCSAFIPSRLLPPTRTNSKGKQRADSGTGTPAAPEVHCPKCHVGICVTCRSPAHPSGTCSPLEFGIDKETAELLQKWGYKRCPKCAHGVKRMYGCNHMQCRCGAHFCWVCLLPRDECGGNCYEDDDDDYETDEEPDQEEDVDTPRPETATLPAPAITPVSTQETPTEPSSNPPPAVPLPDVIPPPPSTEEPAATAPDSSRIRNLDGGSGRYWEQQDLDFGDEPGDEIHDLAWYCHHDFKTAKVKLADAFTKSSPTGGMECMKCWATIHPEVQMPTSIPADRSRTVAGPASGRQNQTRGRNSRAQGRRTRVLRFNEWNSLRGSRSMEGLQASTSIVTTSRASMATLGSIFSQSPLVAMGAAQTTPGEPAERVLDLYGNTVTTSEKQDDTRRFSLDQDRLQDHAHAPDWVSDGAHSGEKKALSFATKSTPFSFAYECYDCGLLVCGSCKEKLLAAQEEEDDEDDNHDGSSSEHQCTEQAPGLDVQPEENVNNNSTQHRNTENEHPPDLTMHDQPANNTNTQH